MSPCTTIFRLPVFLVLFRTFIVAYARGLGGGEIEKSI